MKVQGSSLCGTCGVCGGPGFYESDCPQRKSMTMRPTWQRGDTPDSSSSTVWATTSASIAPGISRWTATSPAGQRGKWCDSSNVAIPRVWRVLLPVPVSAWVSMPQSKSFETHSFRVRHIRGDISEFPILGKGGEGRNAESLGRGPYLNRGSQLMLRQSSAFATAAISRRSPPAMSYPR